MAYYPPDVNASANGDMPPPTLDDPYADMAFRQRQLQERQKAIADQVRLAQQQLAQRGGGRMVGKFYVPDKAPIVPAMTSIVGSFMQPQMDEQQRSLNAEEASLASGLIKRLASGDTERRGPPQEDGTLPQPTNRPLRQDERLQLMRQGSQLPSLKASLTKAFEDQLIQEPVREEARQEKRADREDRQEAAAQTLASNLALKREQLQEQARQADQRSADMRQSAADRAEAAREANAIRAQLAQLQRDALDYRKQHDTDVLNQKREAAGQKPLTVGEVTKLQGLAGRVENADRFKDKFQDSYAGLTGDISRAVGTYSPIATENAKNTSAFWNDYQAHKNAVRHDLFGSALTAQEKGEWEKSDINSTMQPDMIRRNLQRRAELERRAYEKIEAAVSSGSRADQINALRPSAAPNSGSTSGTWAPPASERTYSPAEATRLPKGTRFKGSDGNFYVR